MSVSALDWPRASGVIVTVWSGLKFSSATRAVSTLVRLAGATSRSGCLAQRIAPVSRSTRMPARARIAGAPAGIDSGIVKLRLALATCISNDGVGVGVVIVRGATETPAGVTGRCWVVASVPTATPATSTTRPKRADRGTLNMKGCAEWYPEFGASFRPFCHQRRERRARSGRRRSSDEQTSPEALGESVSCGPQLRLQHLLLRERAEHHRDRDLMVGAMDHADRIPAGHTAGHDHPQVGSGRTAVGEALDPQLLLEPAGKGPARDARGCHLEHAVVADLPALADQRPVDVEAGGGQVLAEHPVAERTAEFGLPVIEVLTGIRIHRLVGTAVGARIADGVACGATESQPGSRIPKFHRLARRAFADAGDAGIGEPGRLRGAQVDGEERCHGWPKDTRDPPNRRERAPAFLASDML